MPDWPSRSYTSGWIIRLSYEAMTKDTRELQKKLIEDVDNLARELEELREHVTKEYANIEGRLKNLLKLCE